MIEVRYRETPNQEVRCKGCAAPATGQPTWYRLIFRDYLTGEVAIWLCLECGKNTGTLLLRDYLISR